MAADDDPVLGARPAYGRSGSGPRVSRYAVHVGRVGALAVALGVGAGAASLPAVAYADVTGSTGAGDSSASSSSSGRDEPAAAERAGTSANDDDGGADSVDHSTPDSDGADGEVNGDDLEAANSGPGVESDGAVEGGEDLVFVDDLDAGLGGDSDLDAANSGLGVESDGAAEGGEDLVSVDDLDAGLGVDSNLDAEPTSALPAAEEESTESLDPSGADGPSDEATPPSNSAEQRRSESDSSVASELSDSGFSSPDAASAGGVESPDAEAVVGESVEAAVTPVTMARGTAASSSSSSTDAFSLAAVPEVSDSDTVPTAVFRPGPVETVVSGVLRIVGLVPAGGGAVDNPVVTALLAWSRRIDGFLFAQSPTAVPVQTNNGSVLVTGTIGGTDPYGAPLTYRVIDQPTNGTVEIGSDGTYAYTASADLATAGGTDSFTAEVRQGGFRLHRLGASSTITVPVAVTVAPNLAPVQSGPSAVIATVPTTGTVIGQIAAVDPNGDPVTYRHNWDAAKGRVTVFGREFRYTPTEEARILAADPLASAADKRDHFTITASDGVAATDISVSVDIDPPQHGLVDTLAVGTDPRGVALAPDGARAYVSNADGVISVIDTATGQVIETLRGVTGSPRALTVTPDGDRLYVTDSAADVVSAIDLSSNSVGSPSSIDTVAVGSFPTAVALSADGSQAWVVNANSGTVSVIDTATDSVINTIAVGASPTGIALAENAGRGYVTNFVEGTVAVIDTAAGSLVDTIAIDAAPSAVAVSLDETRLYIADSRSGHVAVIDTADHALIDTIEVGTDPWTLAVSPDGQSVYTVNRGDNTVSVIATGANQVIATIDVGDAPVAVAFNPAGTRAYVVNSNGGTLSEISLIPVAAGQSSDLGFTFTNVTPEDLELTEVFYSPGTDPGTNIRQGYVLKTGESTDITILLSDDADYSLTFTSVTNPETTYEYTGSWGGRAVTSKCVGSSGSQCLGHFARFHFLPGGPVTIDAKKDPDLAAGLLRGIDTIEPEIIFFDDPLRTSFQVASGQDTVSERTDSGIAEWNGSDLEIDRERSYSVTRSRTTSVSTTASLGLNFWKVLNASFQATFKTEETETTTFEEKLNFTLLPKTGIKVLLLLPVKRLTGDYAAAINDPFAGVNAVIRIDNLDVDWPDPTRETGKIYDPWDGDTL